MNPLASFVIPVKDGQAHIAEAIQSCLDQSVKRIEVIVVNDGSTDNTQSRIEYYAGKDKRVRLIDLPENIGRSLARNLGMEHAKSDFIFVLDSDDVSLEYRVRDTLNFFKKNPGIDLVYGQFQLIDYFGNILGYVEAETFDYEKAKESKFNKIGHSTMAFKKSVFEKIRYTDGPFSQNAIDDWKFQIDAYQCGFRFGVIKKILSKYRMSDKPRDEKKILALKEACLK